MPDIPAQLDPGAAVFYGVTPETAHLWRQAKAEGRDWYYIDNSYFDVSRGTYYRITKNAIQRTGIRASDGKRFKALGVKLQPWRSKGDHIVVCLQSPAFMKTVAGIDHDAWWQRIQPGLRATGRQIRVRGWNANKAAQMASLQADLRDAWSLVTWSSAAAVEALIAGVQVMTAPECAAYEIGVRNRSRWAESLADNQWTIAEMRDGTAWKALNA